MISFDEMKVEDLVYDKHSGELIGFVDIGYPDLNYATFKDSNDLASHVFVFYIRGISSDLKFSFAYFPTKGATHSQIFSLFWKTVSILELTCKLNVIAAVSDGASANRCFFKMHSKLSFSFTPFVYRTINLYDKERYIYFFADAPHLMKTMRNAIYHSKGDGSGSRKL